MLLQQLQKAALSDTVLTLRCKAARHTLSRLLWMALSQLPCPHATYATLTAAAAAAAAAAKVRAC